MLQRYSCEPHLPQSRVARLPSGEGLASETTYISLESLAGPFPFYSADTEETRYSTIHGGQSDCCHLSAHKQNVREYGLDCSCVDFIVSYKYSEQRRLTTLPLCKLTYPQWRGPTYQCLNSVIGRGQSSISASTNVLRSLQFWQPRLHLWPPSLVRIRNELSCGVMCMPVSRDHFSLPQAAFIF